jgi:hypothetical protein
MGFRFRKSIKIIPGVRLNISKSGMSTSIGTRGATVNISKRGTRTTLGIPGTGISYSDMTPSQSRASDQPASEAAAREDRKNLWLGIAFIVALIAIAWLIDKL